MHRIAGSVTLAKAGGQALSWIPDSSIRHPGECRGPGIVLDSGLRRNDEEHSVRHIAGSVTRAKAGGRALSWIPDSSIRHPGECRGPGIVLDSGLRRNDEEHCVHRIVVSVTPANAGVQGLSWIPAFAGMTRSIPCIALQDPSPWRKPGARHCLGFRILVSVTPANAGVQGLSWIPAFAGMTRSIRCATLQDPSPGRMPGSRHCLGFRIVVSVTPANAGVQGLSWIPAFAGMTRSIACTV